MKRYYQYVIDWLNWKRLSQIAAGLLILSLLPILYLSFFNYATGDDLGYGAALHRVIAGNGGLKDMAAAVMENVRNSYHTFQGTWSSIALFSMEPSVWGEHFYTVTTWIALFCLIFCQGCLIRELLVRRMGLPRSSFLFLYSLMVFLQVQYMPFHRSGLFWYTGMAHYVIPYGACMLGLFWMLRFLTTGKKRQLIGCFLTMTYLGGAGYPEIVLAVMFFLLTFLWAFIGLVRRQRIPADVRKYLWLLLPFCSLLIGFVISAKAPGNRIRGGAGFGFDVETAVRTIGGSLLAGITDAVHYFVTVRPMILFVLVIMVCAWETIPISDKGFLIKHPIRLLMVLYLSFSAIHAPEIYVGEDVQAGISGGVYNSYFFVFTVCVLLGAICVTAVIKSMLAARIGENHLLLKEQKEGEAGEGILLRELRAAVLLLIPVFCVIFRSHLIGGTTDYVALEYIRSGQLADYRQQMKERLEILEDPAIQDAVLDPMNDWQGPLMHFPVTENPEAFTNTATADYYGKRSVVVKQE